MTDIRGVQELLDLATEEGITLPYPPEEIIFFEDRGQYVDLPSGDMWRDHDHHARLQSGALMNKAEILHRLKLRLAVLRVALRDADNVNDERDTVLRSEITFLMNLIQKAEVDICSGS